MSAVRKWFRYQKGHERFHRLGGRHTRHPIRKNMQVKIPGLRARGQVQCLGQRLGRAPLTLCVIFSMPFAVKFALVQSSAGGCSGIDFCRAD